jgi:hypothetical protein
LAATKLDESKYILQRLKPTLILRACGTAEDHPNKQSYLVGEPDNAVPFQNSAKLRHDQSHFTARITVCIFTGYYQGSGCRSGSTQLRRASTEKSRGRDQ